MIDLNYKYSFTENFFSLDIYFKYDPNSNRVYGVEELVEKVNEVAKSLHNRMHHCTELCNSHIMNQCDIDLTRKYNLWDLVKMFDDENVPRNQNI